MKKYKEIRNRILLFRESNVDHLLPYDIFIEKVRAAVKLVDFVEQQDIEKEIIQQARNYLIVMSVAAVESYFKRTAEMFIDSGWTEDTFKEFLQKDKVSLADIFMMDKENFTLAEMISVTNNFQNLDSINHFYNKMLDCSNFIKEVSEFEIQIGNKEYFILKNEVPEFRKDIYELFHYRHLIIHHDTYKRRISYQHIQRILNSLMSFVFASDLYLMEISDRYSEVK